MVPDIIVPGRVQADPNRVPKPASMNRGERSFDQALRQAEQGASRRDQAAAAEQSDRNPSAAPPQEPEPVDPHRDPLPRSDRNPAPPSTRDSGTDGAASPTLQGATSASQGTADNTRATSRGPAALSTSRHPVAPEAPVVQVARGPEGLAAAAVTDLTVASNTGTMASTHGLSGANPGPIKGDPQVAGVAASDLRHTPKATAAQPGYRTYSPQLMQQAEQARDSVFRQIMFRIQGDRSEMRVLLDPPELGKMDMTMVVDKAGVMQLSITAERPELALMLNKYMPELRQSLAAHGLQIGSADVNTGDGSSPRDFGGSAGRRHDPSQADEPGAFDMWAREGYIRADGLDFWV